MSFQPQFKDLRDYFILPTILRLPVLYHSTNNSKITWDVRIVGGMKYSRKCLNCGWNDKTQEMLELWEELYTPCNLRIVGGVI
jgi:hypothetical protein